MNAGYFIPLALVVAAIVAIAGYSWVAARGNRASEDLLMVAVIALIASCTARPGKAAVVIVPARAPVIVVPRPAVIPVRPAPAPARSAPTTEPVRPAPVVVPVVPARPVCTDERRARKECQ